MERIIKESCTVTSLLFFFFKRKGSDRHVHAGVLTHSVFGVAHNNNRLVVVVVVVVVVGVVVVVVAVLSRVSLPIECTLGGDTGGDTARATGCDNEQRYPDDTGEPLSSARILSRTTLRATLLRVLLLRDRPGED